MGLFHVLSFFLPKTSIFSQNVHEVLCITSCILSFDESESSAAEKSPEFEQNWRRTCSSSPLMFLTAVTLSLDNFSRAGFAECPVWKVSFMADSAGFFYGFFKCDHCGINFLQIVLHLTTSVNSFLVHRLFDHKSDLGKRRLPLEGPHPWQTEILTLPILTRYQFWQS